jgi:hypothetical protein
MYEFYLLTIKNSKPEWDECILEERTGLTMYSPKEIEENVTEYFKINRKGETLITEKEYNDRFPRSLKAFNNKVDSKNKKKKEKLLEESTSIQEKIRNLEGELLSIKPTSKLVKKTEIYTTYKEPTKEAILKRIKETAPGLYSAYSPNNPETDWILRKHNLPKVKVIGSREVDVEVVDHKVRERKIVTDQLDSAKFKMMFLEKKISEIDVKKDGEKNYHTAPIDFIRKCSIVMVQKREKKLKVQKMYKNDSYATIEAARSSLLKGGPKMSPQYSWNKLKLYNVESVFYSNLMDVMNRRPNNANVPLGTNLKKLMSSGRGKHKGILQILIKSKRTLRYIRW